MADNAYDFNAYLANVGQDIAAGNSPFDTFNGTPKPQWYNLGASRVSMRIAATTSAQCNVYDAVGGTTTGGLSVAFRFILHNTPVALGYIIEFRTSTGILRLMLDTSRRMYLHNGSVAVGATSSALSLNTEYIIRISGKQNTSSSDSLARLKISSADDATTIHTVDVTNTTLAAGTINYLAIGNLTTAQDLTADFIDLHWTSDYFGWVDPTVHPTNPTGLAWDGQTLSWTAYAGATSYQIEADGTVVASGVTGTSWTDPSAAAGVARKYRVRASL